MDIRMKDRITNLSGYTGELCILIAVAVYVIGLLNLTFVGSLIFMFCGFTGTFLLVTGLVVKLEGFPTSLRSKEGLHIVLFYGSALLLTTSAIMLFADVSVATKISRELSPSLPGNPTNAGVDYGGYWATTAPSPFSGIRLELIRPYVWLVQPLAIVGVLLFVLAVALNFLDW